MTEVFVEQPLALPGSANKHLPNPLFTWMFTESAPRPNQSSIRDIHLSVCLSVPLHVINHFAQTAKVLVF